MAITSQSASVGQGGLIRLRYQSNQPNPVYHIYRDGRLVRQTHRPESVLRIDSSRTPVFRVTDEETAAYAHENDGRAVLNWNRVAACKEYRVEVWDGAAWQAAATLPDIGAGRLQWISGQLEDDATVQYRVVAKGYDGNETTAAAVALLVQRTPDPPAVVAAVDLPGLALTVSGL